MSTVRTLLAAAPFLLAAAPAAFSPPASSAPAVDATPTPDGTPVDTKIRRVTVYSDRARVTRSGSIRLSSGRQRLVVTGLPNELLSDSVSASLPGQSAAKILSIEVEQSFGKHTTGAQAKQLLDQEKALQQKQRALQDDLNTLATEEQFLRSVSVKNKTDDHGRPLPLAIDPASWSQTLGFVSDGLTGVLARERAKQKEQSDLAKQMQALETDLAKVRSYESEAAKTVAIEVEGGQGASVDVDVTYTIAGPSWRPAYDVRVLSSSGKVEVVTHGVVRQYTGEDWKDVDLTLSTANPQQGADVPQLLAWRLGDTTQYAYAAGQGGVGAMGAGIALASNAPAPPPPPPDLDEKSVSKTEAKPAEEPDQPEMDAREEARDEDADGEAVGSEDMAESLTVTGSTEGDVGGSAAGDDLQDVPTMKAPQPAYHSASGVITGQGGGYGRAAAGPIAGKMQVTRSPAPMVAIRALGPNYWSLPAGHTFTFQNAESDSFSWSGDLLYCPSPRQAAGGFDYAFKPERKVTILSDGRERKLELSTTKFPATLQYEIVAPLSTKAYLRGTMTNDRKQPFLAGESFVFLDEDFVGRAFVGTIAPGEKLDLSLGVDDEVKVERRVEQTAENKGILLGKKERTVYTILLSVRSFKKRPIDVVLHDQMPLTWQKDDIDVDKLEVKPDPYVELGADGKPVKTVDDGIVDWKLSIAPGDKATAKLQYAVERPRDFDLIETRRPQ